MAQANLTENETRLYREFLLSLSALITTASIYELGHSALASFYKRLDVALAELFRHQAHLYLGVSPDGILIKGAFFEKENETFRKLAKVLYTHAISGVTLNRGLSARGLDPLVEFLIGDLDGVEAAGGWARILEKAETRFVSIEEIDYRKIIFVKTGEALAEEGFDKAWSRLVEAFSAEGYQSPPAGSKDSIMGLLQSPTQTAERLNVLAKDLGPAGLLEAARVLRRMAVAAKETLFAADPKCKENLEKLWQRLGPQLIGAALEEDAHRESEYAQFLSVLSRDLGEETTVRLVEALIRGQSRISERVLLLLHKLCPDKERHASIAQRVAADLLEKGGLDEEFRRHLLDSVNELLLSHPEDQFMSVFYRKTIAHLEEKGPGPGAAVVRAIPKLPEYLKDLEQEALEARYSLLIYELLKSEADPRDFVLFADKLNALMGPAVRRRDLKFLKDVIVSLFDRAFLEADASPVIKGRSAKFLEELSADRELAKSLAGVVKDGAPAAADEAGEILSRLGAKTAGFMLDFYLAETDASARERFACILGRMKGEAPRLVELKLKKEGLGDPGLLYRAADILNRLGTEEAAECLKRLYGEAAPNARYPILGALAAQPRPWQAEIFLLGIREKDGRARKASIEGILRLKDAGCVARLFGELERRNFFGGRDRELIEAAEKAAELKAKEAAPLLARLFLKKPFGWFGKRERLRVSLVWALARIGTEEAMEAVRKGSADRSGAVRSACEHVMGPSHKGTP